MPIVTPPEAAAAHIYVAPAPTNDKNATSFSILADGFNPGVSMISLARCPYAATNLGVYEMCPSNSAPSLRVTKT